MPPPLGCLACRASLFVFVFPNVSACAGLLVSGYWFSGHFSNSCAQNCHLLACCLHFGNLGAILAPWEHPGGMMFRKWIGEDFDAILGSRFERFFCTEDVQTKSEI